MPHIGIIRGFGEGEAATGYIIKIIKALRKRFRTKIQYSELPVGNYYKYGCTLNDEAIRAMRSCDCIFAGDMKHNANPVEYGVEDIVIAMDNNLEYTCIQGIDKWANVNVRIASYFDGGFSLREGLRGVDGCAETRICSTYSAMNIVKSVTRQCEERRRRLAFVKDGDNEYCADLFYSKFSDFTMPLTNFRLLKFSIRDIVYEIMYKPEQFDTIFASKTFSEYVSGTYFSMLKNEFLSYVKYAEQKSVYTVNSICDNSPAVNFTPTLLSYLGAFSDLLKDEFSYNKEAVALNIALNAAYKKGISPEDGDEFIKSVIDELDKPLNGVYTKKSANRRYIIK